MNAIKDLAPNVEHKNCARYICGNWKKKGLRGRSSSLCFGIG